MPQRQPEEPPEASVQEQKKDGLVVASSMMPDIPMMEPQKTSGSSIPDTPTYMNQSKQQTTTATNTSGSTVSPNAPSNGTVASTSAGATGMATTASNVNDAASLMARVEENTRKTYEVLAQHLPNLDAMTKILTAILAASVNGRGSGLSGGGTNTVGELSSILAVGK